MKNFVLLIILTTLLASCNFNAQRKAEINEEIMQLNKQTANLTDQRIKIKDQRENLVAKLNMSLTRDLSEAELNDIQINYQKQMKSFEIRENKCEISILKNKLEIEKLKQEYLRY